MFAYDDAMTPMVPAGLGEPGTRVWNDTLAAFELNPVELTILGQLARNEDLLTDIYERLLTEDLMVEGSRGQMRPNPLMARIDALSRAQASLATALNLPLLPAQESQRDGTATVKKFRRHDGHAA